MLEDAVAALTSHEWVVSVPRGLQEALLARLAPMRAERAHARYHELMDDRAELTRLLRVGADKAGAVARATLQRAYDHIGLLPR